MNLNWKSAFLAAALLAASSVPAAAGVLYTQPSDGTGDLYASQNDTNGFGSYATMYDNFTLGTSSNINEVAWTGGYYNGSPAPIAGFLVTFWLDNAGQPSAAGVPYAISGTANETLGTLDYYTYDVVLSSAFAAAANTQYWLSIVPTIGYPPQWGWASGTGGDGAAYQDYFGTRSPWPTDMAFTLSGTTGTPEPVSFSLAGIGLGLVGLASWKRRKQGV